MILSDRHKFIFFHLYKTGGTSLSAALAAWGQFVRTPHAHITPCEFKRRNPTKYDRYYTFAFVRNPFDWQASLYYYVRAQTNHRNHEIVRALTFPEYIEWMAENEYRTQYELLSEEGDRESPITLSFIGRYEKLRAGYEKACKSIGIPRRGLPWRNKSVGKPDWRTLYDESLRQRLVQLFAQDFEVFKYPTELR